jgi:hypothetical protein
MGIPVRFILRFTFFCVATYFVWKAQGYLDQAIATNALPPRPNQPPDPAMEYLKTERECLRIGFWAIIGCMAFISFARFRRGHAKVS